MLLLSCRLPLHTHYLYCTKHFPVDNPITSRLRHTRDIYATAIGEWEKEERDFDNAMRKDALATAQTKFSRRIAADRYEALCARFDDDSEASRKALARLRSCACREAPIFLDTLPVGATLQLSNDAFACGMRHRLGLGQMPPEAPVVSCARLPEPSNTPSS
jgi:hypothetical protein